MPLPLPPPPWLPQAETAEGAAAQMEPLHRQPPPEPSAAVLTPGPPFPHRRVASRRRSPLRSRLSMPLPLPPPPWLPRRLPSMPLPLPPPPWLSRRLPSGRRACHPQGRLTLPLPRRQRRHAQGSERHSAVFKSIEGLERAQRLLGSHVGRLQHRRLVVVDTQSDTIGERGVQAGRRRQRHTA